MIKGSHQLFIALLGAQCFFVLFLANYITGKHLKNDKN